MATISQIRTTIKAKLDGLSTPSVVYDVFKLNIEWHPAIMFEPTELTNEVLDTCNNLRTYRFGISILQETESIKRDQAMDILIWVFDETINAFDNDFDLWGLCEGGVNPIGWRFGVAETENWDILFVDFTLECKTKYHII